MGDYSGTSNNASAVAAMTLGDATAAPPILAPKSGSADILAPKPEVAVINGAKCSTLSAVLPSGAAMIQSSCGSTAEGTAGSATVATG